MTRSFPPSLLAQGGFGEGIAPLCELIGFGRLFVLIVSVIVLLKPLKQPPLKRSATIAIFIAAPLLLLCVAFLESGSSTHAWRHFARTHLIDAIDARTGTPLPIKYDLHEDFPEDPFIKYSMGIRNRPDELEVESNIDLSLVVRADGYDEKVIQVTTNSPAQIQISLSRTSPIPATHPN